MYVYILNIRGKVAHSNYYWRRKECGTRWWGKWTIINSLGIPPQSVKGVEIVGGTTINRDQIWISNCISSRLTVQWVDWIGFIFTWIIRNEGQD